MRLFKSLRQTTAIFLSALLILPLFPAISLSAEIGNTIYEYERFIVTYKIVNEWEGNQNVEIIFTNTSAEPILNWALIFDAKGEIKDLWNGTVIANTDTDYLIKNAGYNYEIAPNQSVNFGYTVSGDSLSLPENFDLCSTRVDVDASNYTTSLNIIEEWDTGLKGELILTNISSAPIEAWKLSFNSSFELSDLWNGKLIEGINGRYTIASELWSNPIQPNTSVNIGFVGTKVESTEIIVDQFALSQIVIEDQIPEIPEEEVLILAAFAQYNSDTNAVDLKWFSTIPDGTFEILTSDDNITFSAIGSTENSDQFSLQTGFSQKYIKVSQTTAAQYAESSVFLATQTPTGYDVNFLDSDNDFLVDILEETIGSDPLNSDTDGDGLSDYEESIILGTNPLVFDSVSPGISDSEADCDNDQLSNRYELDNETNPLYADSDSDGLIDGDEVYVHLTQPLNEDTDLDGLLDGDEIAIGTNPLNESTYNVPDIEYTQSYVLLSDSDIFSDINTEGAPYTLSVEMVASGNVPKYLSASESSYSTVVQNDAMLGRIVELEYSASYFIDEVQLNFQIQDDLIPNVGSAYAAVSPEFEGIKRLCVFRYFEDINMLLPVETYYDEENQLVYAITDMVGTYCLIDMDQWLESIGVLPMDIVEYSASEASENSSYTNGSSEYSMPAFHSPTEKYGVVQRRAMPSTNQVRCERFNGHRYAVIDTGDMSWTDAKAYCEYMGGHLVTITDEHEQAYINSFLLWGNKNLYWIGAYRDGTQFKWITGETFEYDNWDGGEPSNEQENVVHMYRNSWLSSQLGTWNDTSDYVSGTAFHSTINVGLLCEWELPVNILYGASLRSCTRASQLTNVADADWDGDGIPNWKEIRIDPNLGYWDFDGTYVPATLKDYMNLKSGIIGFGAPFLRYSVNPVIIPVLPTRSDPEKADTDGDGLMDGAAQYAGGKIIAPIDPNPNKADGPAGVWKNHIATATSSGVPTSLIGWYGHKQTNLPNFGVEGIGACIDESLYLVLEGKIVFSNEDGYIFLQHLAELSLAFANTQQSLDDAINALTECMQDAEMSEALEIEIANLQNQIEKDSSSYLNGLSSVQLMIQNLRDYVAEGEDADKILASLGSRFLNFKADSRSIIHSQRYSWQSLGGYNNGYDAIFRHFTGNNMDREKFGFTVGSTEYILWTWRGDYLNLGAGAEIGFYQRPSAMAQDPNGLDHYFVWPNSAIPMQLYLYNYNGSSNITNIFSWRPTETQWWITGFNPEYVNNVNVNTQVMVGCVDFSKYTNANGENEMYDKFKEEMVSIIDKSKYLLWDDINTTVWILWGE